jgi:hypothetical protein
MTNNAKSSYRFEVPENIKSFKLVKDEVGFAKHRYYYEDPSFNYCLMLIRGAGIYNTQICLYAHRPNKLTYNIGQHAFKINNPRSFKRGCNTFFKKLNVALLLVENE